MKRGLVAAACVLSTMVAAAANAPVANLNVGFAEMASTGVVGADSVGDNGTLYWMFEGTGRWQGQSVNAWLLVWDPVDHLSVSGTVSFDQAVVQVFGSPEALMASSRFERAGYVYDYTNPAISLEPQERAGTTFAGGVLSFTWTGRQPGDVARVLTAVPETGTLALMALGLVATGLHLRTRARA